MAHTLGTFSEKFWATGMSKMGQSIGPHPGLMHTQQKLKGLRASCFNTLICTYKTRLLSNKAKGSCKLLRINGSIYKNILIRNNHHELKKIKAKSKLQKNSCSKSRNSSACKLKMQQPNYSTQVLPALLWELFSPRRWSFEYSRILFTELFSLKTNKQKKTLKLPFQVSILLSSKVRN